MSEAKTPSPVPCRKSPDTPYSSDTDRLCAADIAEELSLQKLSLPLSVLRGVGPKTCRLLEIKNLKTVEDLLFFLPRRYEDRRVVKTIDQVTIGSRETVIGRVMHAGFHRYGNTRIFSLAISDGLGTLSATWFRGRLAYLTDIFRRGTRVILSGDITVRRTGKTMIHPDFEILDDDDENLMHFQRIVPVYSETEGLTQKTIRRIMTQALNEYAEYLVSPIPPDICRGHQLIDIHSAVRNVHFPPADHDITPYNAMRSEAHRRLIYDEFFYFQLGMALRKKKRTSPTAAMLMTERDLAARFHRLLPYALTPAQRRAIHEIENDLTSGRTMHRLLQGDVGCGKTAVAFSAVALSCGNGCQAAIMAPTEILATQHFHTVRNWAGALGLDVVLLTGSASGKEREALYEQIKTGTIHVVIGTHALIQERVVFKNLRLVIIDEQHRFGVAQRADLRRKGIDAHLLVMTATPIPRTLAMTWYGDLDLSVIDELPPGRSAVNTLVVRESQRGSVYRKIRDEIAKGNKAFIVYPLVEESQNTDMKNATDMAEHLQKDIFREYRVGLLHGKMADDEKERIMTDFRTAGLDILVSTTVIEVGIEIPQASLMIIEHAERFGLSQLHQLRGRVGRSDIPSECILMAGRHIGGDALKRLRIMERTNDGFEIAEMDLKLRGPGEFLGTRQAGIPDFRVADLMRDNAIHRKAKADAVSLVDHDPNLSQREHALLRHVLQRKGKDEGLMP